MPIATSTATNDNTVKWDLTMLWVGYVPIIGWGFECSICTTKTPAHHNKYGQPPTILGVPNSRNGREVENAHQGLNQGFHGLGGHDPGKSKHLWKVLQTPCQSRAAPTYQMPPVNTPYQKGRVCLCYFTGGPSQGMCHTWLTTTKWVARTKKYHRGNCWTKSHLT